MEAELNLFYYSCNEGTFYYSASGEGTKVQHFIENVSTY